MSTGLTTIFNMEPELPIQYSEFFLSTPQFNLIHSFGANLYTARAHIGKNFRMSRYERLSTDGGFLDGSGIDPAPEPIQRTDVDATVEIYGKVIGLNEQVTLFENDRVLTKAADLLGQWMREKEDLLMRDLLASNVSYINAVGGTNGDSPSNISFADVNNIERILLGNNAKTTMEVIEAEDRFGTAPTRDAFVALAHTDLTSDLQNTQNVVLKNQYPSQDGLRPEEYCSIGRFRFFVSSKASKGTSTSLLGNTIYSVAMYGLESFAKIDQNGYSSKLGYRPPWVASNVAQNSSTLR